MLLVRQANNGLCIRDNLSARFVTHPLIRSMCMCTDKESPYPCFVISMVLCNS